MLLFFLFRYAYIYILLLKVKILNSNGKIAMLTFTKNYVIIGRQHCVTGFYALDKYSNVIQ